MRTFLAIALSTALSGAFAAAATPAEQNRLLSRYVDTQTLAVAYIDATRVDPGVLDSIVPAGAGDTKKVGAMMTQAKAELTQWVNAFKAAGGKEVYVIMGLGDLPEWRPLVVAPLAEGADEKALRAVLAPGAPVSQTQPGDEQLFTAERIGSDLVAGRGAAIRRVREAHPAERPDVSKAMGAGGDAPVQVWIVPDETLRRALQESFPSLPEKVGGGATADVLRGVKWANASVAFRPSVSLRVMIQSEGAPAAAALEATIERAFQAAREDPSLRKHIPAIDEVTRALLPKLKEDRLVLELSTEDLRTTVGKTLLGPLMQAREQAEISVSMNQIKQLALGCILYATDHKGEYPADLESLVKSKYLNAPNLLVNPRQPERPVGYVYVQPTQKREKAPAQNYLIYEAFDTWPDTGIAVGFHDGHVELVRDKAKFDAGLASSKKQ